VDLFSDEPKRGGGRHPREYFFTELLEPKLRPARNAAEIERNARDLRTLVAEFHTRLTQPLLPLTVALVGITILLSGHFNRRGQLKQIVVAVVAGGAVIIFSYVLRNYAPKMPALNAVMYVNALLPLILSLYFLIFPRPLTQRRGHQQREPAT
ncbi:MAG: LptF/LptG family permease, partial [Alphaproteobacteria bacterium]|nr:LptF/LptG family permease [Alphaproteobacteria bacterium]